MGQSEAVLPWRQIAGYPALYRSDFEDFTSFCREYSLPRLPTSPSTVALYISDRAGSLAAATIIPVILRLVLSEQFHEITPKAARKEATRVFRRADPSGTTTSYISLTSIPAQSGTTPMQCQRSKTAEPHPRRRRVWTSSSEPCTLLISTQCGIYA